LAHVFVLATKILKRSRSQGSGLMTTGHGTKIKGFKYLPVTIILKHN
jgi:hypothetical protein